MARLSFIIRIAVCVAFAVIFLIAVGSRLYYVQIVRNKELISKARRVYTTVASKKGERGRIYDYNGNLIVGNIPCADVMADPKMTGDDKACAKAAELLSKCLRMPKSEIFEALATKKRGDRDIRYKAVRKELTLDTAKAVEQVIAKNKLKGIFLEEKTKRFYPKGELLSNVVGLTNSTDEFAKPINGIEKAFNESLTPTKAKSVYERDRKGVPFAYGKKQMNQERNGNDVYLTIQEPIQAIVEEELETLVKDFKPEAAYAIMADPFTGNILAIAQRPTFNPNNRKDIAPEMWRDRFLTDVFEPGSTMKAIPIAGALDYGAVTPNTMFDCEKGAWFYAGRRLRDSHPEGVLSVTDIIKVSSNIGTAKIALKLGEEKLYQTFRRFGFGQKTGIPIQPEAVGQFKKLDRWEKLSITRFPIGQGISCSPVQLVRAYCALANGGTLLKMRLVDRECNPETGEIVFKEIEEGSKVFMKDETHVKIVKMLSLVTKEGGTGIKAHVPGYDVAGKTGTSQKWVNGQFSESLFFASFIGFVPAENPAFVLLVMADEPKGNHYGGIVSAPPFRRIAEKTLRYLNVPPQHPEEMQAQIGKKD